MGYKLVTFAINDEKIYSILERAGKYKLRSVLIVRALQSVDLEELLRELMQEVLTGEVVGKEPPVRSQKPTTGPAVDDPKDTIKPEEIDEEKLRKPTLHERFKGLF